MNFRTIALLAMAVTVGCPFQQEENGDARFFTSKRCYEHATERRTCRAAHSHINHDPYRPCDRRCKSLRSGGNIEEPTQIIL